jgi:hypothetical protein
VWERSGEKEDGAWFNTRNQYKGGFKLGVREGAGVFLYATGAKYDGRWADNVKHGHGVYTFDDGTVFKGAFNADRAMPEAGAAPFGPTKHLKLDIEDLVDEEVSARHATAVSLDHLLLRYNSELRGMYRKHAVVAAAAADALPATPGKAVPLSVPGFIALMRVAGVAAADLTVAQIAHAILPAWSRAPASPLSGDPGGPAPPAVGAAAPAPAATAKVDVMDPKVAPNSRPIFSMVCQSDSVPVLVHTRRSLLPGLT